MESELQWGNKNGVIERAEEELEILEFQHPDRFHSLKMELKAFIQDFQSHNLLINSTSTSIYAATQESSSRKKRKKDGTVVDEEETEIVEACHGKDVIKSRCKTDAVLERAQQCLHKIQHLKTMFYITR